MGILASRRTESIEFGAFMRKEYNDSRKQQKPLKSKIWSKKEQITKTAKTAGALTAGSMLLSKAPLAFASGPDALPVAGGIVEKGGAAAGHAIAQTTLDMIGHALDPVLQLLTALSFPVCSLIIVGSFFYLAFGNSEKCWSGVQRGALSYILIQLSPILLSVLRNIGGAL